MAAFDAPPTPRRGVARVLVGDLAGEGLIAVHRPNHVGDRPDLRLLERVLDGLQAFQRTGVDVVDGGALQNHVLKGRLLGHGRVDAVFQCP